MRKEAEIVDELKSAITSGKNKEIQSLIKEYLEYQETKNGNVQHKIQLAYLKFDQDTVIELGDVPVPFILTKTLGNGKITFKNTIFKKTFQLSNLNEYTNKDIEFIDCIFKEKVILTNINHVNNKFLTILFRNQKQQQEKIKLETDSVIIKRLVLVNFIIDIPNFKSIGMKTLYVNKCIILTRLLENMTTTAGLSRVIIRDSIIEPEVTISHLPRIISYSLRITDSVLKGGLTCREHRSFHKLVWFKSVECVRIVLANVTFEKSAFLHIKKFDEIRVNDGAFLGLCKLSTEDGNIVHLATQFNKMFHGNFKNVEIVENSSRYLEDAYFDSSNFNHGKFDSQFKSYVSFKYCKFKYAPDFLGVSFTNHVTFYGAEFSDVKLTESEGRYRLLKDKMREASNDADEMLFSSYELESRHKDFKKNDKWQHFFSLLYWAANNYGRSLMRPVVSILIIWLFFSVLFFRFENSFYVDDKLGLPRTPIVTEIKSSTNSDNNLDHYSWVTNTKFEPKHIQSMKFSAINMLGPLRLISFFEGFKVTTFTYMMLTWIQSVLATILWYLFIVGIKRRFRTG